MLPMIPEFTMELS